jgi:hypothetical protein
MNVNENSNLLCMNFKYEFIHFDITKLDTYYEITHLDKPLYSLSYYKLADLFDICKKLKLPYDNMKKQNVYDNIRSHLLNFNIYKID